MQTLKLFVSLPDAEHPDMELRLSANEALCDVVITLPARQRADAPQKPESPGMATPSNDASDYELGGYAGI